MLSLCCVFQRALSDVVLKDMKSNKENITEPVLAVELLYKQSTAIFQFQRMFHFDRGLQY